MLDQRLRIALDAAIGVARAVAGNREEPLAVVQLDATDTPALTQSATADDVDTGTADADLDVKAIALGLLDERPGPVIERAGSRVAAGVEVDAAVGISGGENEAHAVGLAERADHVAVGERAPRIRVDGAGVAHHVHSAPRRRVGHLRWLFAVRLPF